MLSIHDAPLILWYFAIIAAVFGAVMGSFLHCTAYRVARGEPFLSGHSHCPQCGHNLSTLDLVPVFSWLLLRGRCRYCGAKVPARYFLAEVFMAATAVACLLQFDLSVLCLRNFAFGCCLFCLALVDAESMIIPNGCLLAAVISWVAALPFLGVDVKWLTLRLLAGVVYSGALLGISLVMDKALKQETMGGGDIKLFAVVGLYLGMVGTLLAVLVACLLGLVFAAVAKKGNKSFPFGPSIAAAAWLVLLYGEGPINWYLALIGLA